MSATSKVKKVQRAYRAAMELGNLLSDLASENEDKLYVKEALEDAREIVFHELRDKINHAIELI